MNYLVIPEGLFVDTKNKLTFPSFILKVLNKANEMAKVGILFIFDKFFWRNFQSNI